MINLIKNNWFMKLLSLVLAIVSWVIIVNISDPLETVTIRNIKVLTIHDDLIASKEKSFALEDNGVVSIQIRGRKTIVNNLSDKDFVAEADLGRLSLTNTVEVTVRPLDPKLDIVILNDKKLLNVKIENILTTPFPIVVKTVGHPVEGMAVCKKTVEPAEVNIRAPESLIHNIKEVVAELDVDAASKDVEAMVPIKAFDREGNPINSEQFEVNREQVEVTAQINRIKSIDLRLTKLPAPPQGYVIDSKIITPSALEVAAPDDVLNSLKTIDIPYTEDLFGPLGTENITKSVEIKDYLPKDVYPVTDQDKISVQIVISKEEAKSMIIRTSDIIIKNKKANLQYSFRDSSITVVLRGPKSALGKLQSAKDIEPTVDVSGMRSGTEELPLSFKSLDQIDYGTNNLVVITAEKKE